MITLPSLHIPYVLAKYRKNKPIARPLTTGEIALCLRIFGTAFDTSTVKIIACAYLPWQADDIFIAPNGNLFTTTKHYQDDYSTAALSYQQIFIHEMTHVFQHQQGVNVLYQGAWLQSLYYLSGKRYNPYAYQFDPAKSFWAYNIEQQACIGEAIFLGYRPNIIRPHRTSHHHP
ncbi:MAG: hypothetical protein Q4G13_00820 [Moraxella sp.]|nr:hypothetical protein [Moraxella sp.]